MQLNKASENKETHIVSTFIYRYMPYWPLFLVLTVLSLGVAWIYLKMATPKYEAYATVQVKDEKKGVEESSIAEALKLPTSTQIVENEMEVIRSRNLMNEVVKQLNLYAPVFKVAATKEVSLYKNPPLVVKARRYEKVKPSGKIFFTVRRGGLVISKKQYPYNEWVKTPWGELKFSPVKSSVKKDSSIYFFMLLEPRNVVSSLLNNLKVESTGKLATVLNLRLRDENAQRAKDILNLLILGYNKLHINSKTRSAENSLAFIESRLNGIERELDSIEHQIQHYRARKGAIDLGEQGKSFLNSVGENDRMLSEINMQLAVLNEVEHYVTSKEKKGSILPSTVGLNDRALSDLMQQLYQAELQREKLKETTAENNPLVTPITNEIEQIRPHILEIIRNHRNNLLASKNNLAATNGRFTAMLNSIPQKERELTEISRQYNVKSSIYSLLLEKREQYEMNISSTVADTKIIDMAEASLNPVSPNRSFVFMVALLAALGLSFGLVTIKEGFNQKILFRSEIESFTVLPVVAEISKVKRKESLLVTRSKVSATAEQFRHLKAAIGLYSKNQTIKKIMVTSSIAGEGKSFISANLALSLALASKRVLIIDLDIRNPKVSVQLGVEEQPGITEFLEGSKTPDEILTQTSYDNLFVIGAGADLDNAREQIFGDKLAELLEHFKDSFEYIILDTSPVDPVSDAYVFSNSCDITLFVVRHGYTPKALVQLFDKNNKIKVLKNPSIVFNDVRSRGLFKRNYGFGYGYGYQSVYREPRKKGGKRLLKA